MKTITQKRILSQDDILDAVIAHFKLDKTKGMEREDFEFIFIRSTNELQLEVEFVVFDW